MTNQDARPKKDGQGTAHLDDRPVLDIAALQNLGLTEAQALDVLQGSSCISEQELHDRWQLMGRL